MFSLNQLTGMLGAEQASHLLRRCTYTPTITRVSEFANYTADEAVDALLDTPFNFELEEPIHPITKEPFINSGDRSLIPEGENTSVRRNVVVNFWLERALVDPTIRTKMEFFLHSIFVTASMGRARYFFDHHALIQWSSLGNYKAFATKMTVDNLMLDYLDNTLNKKDAPNENYAREFLELFTIGKGEQAGDGDYTNYTEADVVEAARVLTGFKKSGINTRGNENRTDPDTNLFRGKLDLQTMTLKTKRLVIDLMAQQ